MTVNAEGGRRRIGTTAITPTGHPTRGSDELRGVPDRLVSGTPDTHQKGARKRAFFGPLLERGLWNSAVGPVRSAGATETARSYRSSAGATAIDHPYTRAGLTPRDGACSVRLPSRFARVSLMWPSPDDPRAQTRTIDHPTLRRGPPWGMARARRPTPRRAGSTESITRHL